MQDKAGLVRLEDGVLVERDVLNIVEKIREYDSNLKVQYLPQATRLDQPPYRILEFCKDHKWRVAFNIWKLDYSVLQRIYDADTQKLNILDVLDKHNNKIRTDKKRRYKEALEEDRDKVISVLKTDKDNYTVTMGDKIVNFSASQPSKIVKVKN